MLYAVLQKTLEPPPQEALRQALQGVPGLVPYDAQIILRDAYGILLREQSLEAATQFQRGLAAQGFETEMVPEQSLPPVPMTKFVRRVEFTPDALMVFDPIGRQFPVQWGHLHIVAAGVVQVTEFRQSRHEVSSSHTHLRHTLTGYYADTEPKFETRTKEARADKLQLELLLGRGAARLSIEVDQHAVLLFNCLGDQKTGDRGKDFMQLVQALLKHAPHASVNRGAHYLREKGDRLFYYPTKNAFLEEIRWLLWQINRPGQGGV